MLTKLEIAFKVGDSFRFIMDIQLKLKRLMTDIEIREKGGRYKPVDLIASSEQIGSLTTLIFQITKELERVRELDAEFWTKTNEVAEYNRQKDKLLDNVNIKADNELIEFINFSDNINILQGAYCKKLEQP